MKHKIPEKKDSLKNSFLEVNSKTMNKKDSGDYKKDQNNYLNFELGIEDLEGNILKKHKRNNTSIGEFLNKNKSTNDDDNTKNMLNKNFLKKNNLGKDVKINKSINKSVTNKNNNIGAFSNLAKNQGLLNYKKNQISNKRQMIKKNLTKAALNLSYINDVFPISDLSKNLSSPDNSGKLDVEKQNGTNLINNETQFEISDINELKIKSYVFPSSTKNMFKKDFNTNKCFVQPSLESKQDLMNDYPITNNLPPSDKKNEEKFIKEQKVTLDTVEFDSNNFNFINFESSINIDLLDNISKNNDKNYNQINWNNSRKEINNEEPKRENMSLTSFFGKNNNEIQESKSFFENSIDRFSLFNLKKYNLFIFGGKSKSSDFSSFKLNTEKESWSKIEEIKVQRSDFGILVINATNILVLGGKLYSLTQKESITDSIELIDIQKNTKIKLDIKLKQPKCNFGCVLFENQNDNSHQDKVKIFFVGGGYNGMDVLNNFEFFDFNIKKWVDLPSMPIKRKEFGMILDNNGLIYFIGGVDEKE